MAETWLPYDPEALTRLGVPSDTAAALGERGLPERAYGWFLRNPERELDVAELPQCGPAAFLAQVNDGLTNTYWLRLADGSVWMRDGLRDETGAKAYEIDQSVRGLQGILAALCGLWYSGLDQDDEGYEAAVIKATIEAVSAEPEAFADEQNWWAGRLEEAQYTLPGMVRDDQMLYELVRRDEAGQWVLDHPGYEDEDG